MDLDAAATNPVDGPAAVVAMPVSPLGGTNTPTPPSKQVGNYTITTVRRIATVVIVTVLLYSYQGLYVTDLFPYHPLAMTLAFVAVLPEVVYASSLVKRSKTMADRSDLTMRHILLALLLKTLTLIGFCVIYINKAIRHKVHFKTWHGKLGLLVMLVLIAQVVVGLLLYWRLPSPNALPTLRKAHSWLSLTFGAVSSMTMLLGIGASFFSANVITVDAARWVLAASTLVFILLVCLKE